MESKNEGQSVVLICGERCSNLHQHHSVVIWWYRGHRVAPALRHSSVLFYQSACRTNYLAIPSERKPPPATPVTE